jgi:hypothetical protein
MSATKNAARLATIILRLEPNTDSNPTWLTQLLGAYGRESEIIRTTNIPAWTNNASQTVSLALFWPKTSLIESSTKKVKKKGITPTEKIIGNPIKDISATFPPIILAVITAATNTQTKKESRKFIDLNLSNINPPQNKKYLFPKFNVNRPR